MSDSERATLFIESRTGDFVEIASDINFMEMLNLSSTFKELGFCTKVRMPDGVDIFSFSDLHEDIDIEAMIDTTAPKQ